MRRQGERLTLAVLLTLLPACSGAADVQDAGKSCARIVGGYRDDAFAAIASLDDVFGEQLCTATLIGSSVREHALLTAAHCLDWPIERVRFGENRQSPTLETAITAVFPHPDFDKASGDYDFAIVLVEEAPAHVLPLPLPSAPDGLSVGSELVFAGYGDTELQDANTFRNAVGGRIRSIDELTFDYDQASGGPCDGDSGGPALSALRGVPTVVGVTSYGLGSCWSGGVSGRVSAAMEFLAPFAGAERLGCSEKE